MEIGNDNLNDMSDINPPMSTVYKTVFAFAVFMMSLSIFGGSKGGIGVVLWGYALWLMFRRKNKALTALFKVLFWFDVIAGILGLSLIATQNDSLFASYSMGGFAFVICLAALMAFGLMRFFESQAKNAGDLIVSSDLKAEPYKKYLFATIIFGVVVLAIVISSYLRSTNQSTTQPSDVENEKVKQSTNVNTQTSNETDIAVIKFYRANRNADLIHTGKITLKDLSSEELQDMVAYNSAENNLKKLKAGTTNLDALSVQELINLKAYYKVNNIH